ncbi:MAG: hypothetical protein KatS3mg111_3938 [Pirellulaceae bacterium]|nr:MAG: hypothetical protein KatS3mg111_3938 [Pirellulaceae bacterium]
MRCIGNRLHDRRAGHRRGAVAMELLVAATIFLATATLIGRLTTTCLRLVAHSRQYQVAQTEIDNQLARLVSSPVEDLEAAVRGSELSEWARASLPGAELQAERIDDAFGERVVVRLHWAESHGSIGFHLSRVAWVRPPAAFGNRIATR